MIKQVILLWLQSKQVAKAVVDTLVPSLRLVTILITIKSIKIIPNTNQIYSKCYLL